MKFQHIEGVTAKAMFSNCKKYRYRLEITKENTPKGKTVCVIMQNPSVANSEEADRSVQFLEKLIFQKEYSEFDLVKNIIIVNQFAYIQTNNFDGTDEYIGEDNDTQIQAAIRESDIILIAWGASNSYSSRKLEINKMIATTKGKLLLQTKSHPSRGTYIDFVEPYNT